ncbi:MAG TPA: hypothetical protein VEC12_04475 [Bacteroidia bacterium]|nr:hypothetical protein [Bacteroidia bacterium]
MLERIPIAINITQRLRKLDTTAEYTIDTDFTLGFLYNFSGEFPSSIKYYEGLITKNSDAEYLNHVLHNLANVYIRNGEPEKALEKADLLPRKGNEDLFADVFYSNKMYDSALFYADKAIADTTTNFIPYLIRAQLVYQKDKKQACEAVTKAELLSRDGFIIMHRRNYINPFVLYNFKLEEAINELKKKVCE